MTSQYIESETETSITYPAAPVVTTYPAEAIWDRLEAFVNYRWSETVVTFVVNPPCEVQWQPPYVPFVIDAVDGETALPDAFGAVTLRSRSKVTCTIGGAIPSATVNAAFTRLAEYIDAESDAPGGVSSYSIDVGDVSEKWSRRADHLARAIQNSGAADMLRKYKKAGLAHV